MPGAGDHHPSHHHSHPSPNVAQANGVGAAAALNNNNNNAQQPEGVHHPVRDAANFAITKAKENRVVQFGLHTLAPLYNPVLPLVTPYYNQAEKLASPYIDTALDIADRRVDSALQTLSNTQRNLKRKVDELKPTFTKVRDPKQVKAAVEQVYHYSTEVFLASVASPIRVTSEEFVLGVRSKIHHIWDDQLTPYIAAFYESAKSVYTTKVQPQVSPQVEYAKSFLTQVKSRLDAAWENNVTSVLKNKALPLWHSSLLLTQDIFDKIIPDPVPVGVGEEKKVDDVTLSSFTSHVTARLRAQAEHQFSNAKDLSASTYASVKQFSHDRVLPIAKVDPVAMVESHVIPAYDSTKKNLDELAVRLRDLQSQFQEWSVKARSFGVNPVERVQPLLNSTISKVENVRKGAINQISTRNAHLTKALTDLQQALTDFGKQLPKTIPQLAGIQDRVLTVSSHLAQITQRFASGSGSPSQQQQQQPVPVSANPAPAVVSA